MRPAFAISLLAAMTVGACGSDAPPPQQPQETAVPEELTGDFAMPQTIENSGVGTPLAEREATLGLLNKRNNISSDIKIKPGETRRIGNATVRLYSCEKTAPWENPPETGAFVQLFVNEQRENESEASWRRVFSGWLFKNNPSINVVEHPVYDVWVKDCAMSFPGEEAPAERSPEPAETPDSADTPASDSTEA